MLMQRTPPPLPSICHSSFKQNMDSSPTPNAVNSILFQCAITLEALELSVSLEEKITKLEAFISMLFSCSNQSIGQEMSVSSMWTDATLMLCVAGAHQRRVGIMLRSMGTLSQEDLRGQAERAFLNLANRGLRSSYLEVEKSFLTLARDWLRGHFCVTSLPSDVMPIGNTEWIPSLTLTLTEYNCLRHRFQDLTNGYNKTWWDLEIV